MIAARPHPFWLVFLLALIAGTSAAVVPPADDAGFLSPDQAFQYRLATNDDGTLALSWTIEPAYYLYRKRLTVEGVGGALARVDYPTGRTISDEFFGDSEVYYDSAELTIDPGAATALRLSWQGCADAGLCYPPQQATVRLAQAGPAGSAGGSGAAGAIQARSDAGGPRAATPSSAPALAQDESLARQLSDSSLAWSLLVFAGLGLLLVFTPCVLPMIPILSSVLIGSQAGRLRALALSSTFVGTMALTNAGLGVAAAVAGANLQAALQTPWMIGLLAALFVALALAMFGAYELQLPAAIRDRLGRFSGRQRGGSLTGAAIMGVVSALLASPCMTAPLAGALLFIADSGDTALGGLALLALGLGMGAPLILLATLGAGLLPKPGAWMDRVKAAFGFILLATAIWFLDRVLPPSLTLALSGGLLIGLGVAVRETARARPGANGPATLVTTLGLLLGLWGGLMLIGAAGGGERVLHPLAPFSGGVAAAPADRTPAALPFADIASAGDLEQALAGAGRDGRWTLLDFSADWCISCKVIEQQVFTDPRVHEMMASMQLLRADVTENGPADQALMRELQVVGPPSLLLFGPDGREHRALRTVGEIGADAFFERLRAAHAS